MKRFLAGWSAFLLAYQLPLSAETLTVQVSGIKDPGEIHIAIYDSAEAFEGDKGEKGGPAEGIVDGVVEEAEPGSVIDIGLLDARCRATVLAEPLYDPANERLAS